MALYIWPHYISNWKGIWEKVEILKQGYTNSRYQVAQATKLCMVAPNICGSSIQSLRHVTQLVHRILRLLLDVWKICAPLYKSLYNKWRYFVLNFQWVFSARVWFLFGTRPSIRKCTNVFNWLDRELRYIINVCEMVCETCI